MTTHPTPREGTRPASLRTPDLPHDFQKAWNWPEFLCEMESAFPLTPALSLGERENHPPRYDKSRRSGISSDGGRGTLSSGERARVRGNGAHVFSTGSGCLSLCRPCAFGHISRVPTSFERAKPWRTASRPRLAANGHAPRCEPRTARGPDGLATRLPLPRRGGEGRGALALN